MVRLLELAVAHHEKIEAGFREQAEVLTLQPYAAGGATVLLKMIQDRGLRSYAILEAQTGSRAAIKATAAL